MRHNVYFDSVVSGERNVGGRGDRDSLWKSAYICVTDHAERSHTLV